MLDIKSYMQAQAQTLFGDPGIAMMIGRERIIELEKRVKELEEQMQVVDYFLQDDMRNRFEPRVIDIAYTAWDRRANGKNPDDGGPCDWFNDTRPLMIEGINKIRRKVGLEQLK